MELIFKDYQLDNQIINFTIRNNDITGITGNSKETLIDIINLNSFIKGKIVLNQENIQKNDLLRLKRKISIVEKELNYKNFINNVYQLMEYEIRRKNLKLKNPEKKIYDSLKIVSLNKNILDKSILFLSSSEKKLLQIAISLLSNPEILILDEPFKCLDLKTEKKIFMLLQKIKEQYKKTIILVSDDIMMLYKYTNYLIITKNNKILIEGKSEEVLKKVDFLKRQRIELPKIIEMTYLAKKRKNIKLEYHKDIRDIIKDIYKHV